LAQAQVLRGRDDADETGVDVLVAQGQYAKAAKLLPQIHASDALQQRMKLRAQLLLAAAQRDCPAMQQAIREDAPAPTLIDLQVQQRLQHA
ncbi:hypothetical protein, partial [Campylobacter jejuni]|uniref:hypothetical protein n=1 Tax=Campylobacter jejuni TaxID=197 RepID=UPI001F094F4B